MGPRTGSLSLPESVSHFLQADSEEYVADHSPKVRNACQFAELQGFRRKGLARALDRGTPRLAPARYWLRLVRADSGFLPYPWI